VMVATLELIVAMLPVAVARFELVVLSPVVRVVTVPERVFTLHESVFILPVAVERFELVVLSPVVRVAMLPVAVAILVLMVTMFPFIPVMSTS